MPLSDESVDPVASKNTKNGEMPVSRTTLALRASVPLVPVQEAAAGVVGGGVPVTVTVALLVADPPEPLQLNV